MSFLKRQLKVFFLLNITEQIREQKRAIDRSIRGIERERAKIEREEKKMRAEIKKMALKNQHVRLSINV